MGAITGFSSLSCPLYLKSLEEKEANKTIFSLEFQELLHTVTTLFSNAWLWIWWTNICQANTRQKNSFAQSSGKFRWLKKPNTFLCRPPHLFCSCQDDIQRRLKERHRYSHGWVDGPCNCSLLRVRSLIDERHERAGYMIPQVRDKLYVLIMSCSKGSTRHPAKMHWKISLISNTWEKNPLKNIMRSPKAITQFLRNTRKCLIFKRPEIVSLSSLTPSPEKRGSFCSGERKTVSKISLAFSVTKIHHCTNFVTCTHALVFW